MWRNNIPLQVSKLSWRTWEKVRALTQVFVLHFRLKKNTCSFVLWLLLHLVLLLWRYFVDEHVEKRKNWYHWQIVIAFVFINFWIIIIWRTSIFLCELWLALCGTMAKISHSYYYSFVIVILMLLFYIINVYEYFPTQWLMCYKKLKSYYAKKKSRKHYYTTIIRSCLSSTLGSHVSLCVFIMFAAVDYLMNYYYIL